MSIHDCPPPLTVAVTHLQRRMMGLKPRSLALPFTAASTPAHTPPSRHAWGPQPRLGSNYRKSEAPLPTASCLKETETKGHQHTLKTEAGVLGGRAPVTRLGAFRGHPQPGRRTSSQRGSSRPLMG